MTTEARVEPLHTRMLTVDVRAAEGGALALCGQVLDLRKRGLVPLPGALQLPGVIHHMTLAARVDPAARALTELRVEQPSVAFEPSPATRGESCRDPAGALQALVGVRLDGDFLPALTGCFGGPRGCTHLLTLARLAASTALRVLALEAALPGPPRAPGARVLRRSLTIDGFAVPERAMELAVQLADVHLAREAGDELFDQLASHAEVRAHARLDRVTTRLEALALAERRRTRASLDAPLEDRSAEVADLVGRPLVGGLGAELVRRLGGDAAAAPRLDALLSLAPGYVQCVAALADLFLGSAAGAAAGLGARPDSCFMWRRGGALQRARDEV